MSRMSWSVVRVGVIAVVAGGAVAQAGVVTVANWNMANGPAVLGDPNLTSIFSYMGTSARKFDLLAMVETDTGSAPMTASTASTVFGGTYVSVTARNDGGGDRTGFAYNTATLTLLDSSTVDTGMTHPSYRGHFRPVGTTGLADFYMYAVHLKSGEATADKALRLTEAQLLRTDAATLGSANVIFGGDFNWSGADEITPAVTSSVSGAYRAFAASGAGQTVDPLNQVGAWRGNAAFKGLDTNDPGASMDDRFDMQLISPTLMDGTGLDYVAGSYSIVGNNNTHLLDGKITTGTGAPASVLTSLTAFSDHLPVVANYAFAVPEPATGLALLVAVPLMRRRRQSQVAPSVF